MTTTIPTGTQPTATELDGPTVPQQASVLLGSVAGYMAGRIIDMGLQAGLVDALAYQPGATALDLAERLDLDEFYVRSGVGARWVPASWSDRAMVLPWLPTWPRCCSTRPPRPTSVRCLR